MSRGSSRPLTRSRPEDVSSDPKPESLVARGREIDLRHVERGLSEVPDDRFTFILSHATKLVPDRPGLRIADIGCAAGAFLFQARVSYPSAALFGVDILSALVDAAEQLVPHARFFVGDARSPELARLGPVDVGFMVTVHSLFDDVDEWLDPFLSLLGHGGHGFVFGLFNPHPIDVLVKVRRSGSEAPFDPGWNMVSKDTMRRHLGVRGRQVVFDDYRPGTPKLPDPHDPLRSWTEALMTVLPLA